VQAGDGEQMGQAGIAHGRDHLGRDGAALAGQNSKDELDQCRFPKSRLIPIIVDQGHTRKMGNWRSA
jgi:hypothetical protein